MHLPRGITGFYNPARDPLPPSVDARDFKAVCFDVARCANATVARFLSRDEKFQCSYHTAVISLKNEDKVFEVLCNAHYPFVACIDQSKSQWSKIYFVEAPVVTTLFAETTVFKPLDVDYLRAYPTSEMLLGLSEAERQQIHHWGPEQVGDIIFNDWD